MDERLQKIVDKTRGKFGLEASKFEDYSILKVRDNMGDAFYIFNMKWFPNEVTELVEEGTTPLGTAFISYLIQQEKYKSISFASAESSFTRTHFPNKTAHEVIEWLEEETGLTSGEDFKLTEANANEFYFESEIDGIPLSPSCTIKVAFDDVGKLTSFHWDGTLPSHEQVEKSEFSLTLEEIEPIVKMQLQLVEFPSEARGSFVPVYAMDEVYVTIDGARIMPFVECERAEVQVDEVLEWNLPLEQQLIFEEIPAVFEAKIDEAFGDVGVGKKLTLTAEQIERSKRVVRDVMRSEYPNESGMWRLASLRRGETSIVAFCKLNEANLMIVKRTIVVHIDPETMSMLTVFDNVGGMFGLFDSFASAEKAVVTYEEAFEKMIPYITLDPTYVYDYITGKYVLCGLLDAAEGIDAVTGEVVLLRDL
ncbi:hypothetical protein [Sporosarcina limicola]|uniref:Uncharacterized protein n=1 Tax=Sporosarcina limicola TaxID=34101 RepID=A0A927RCG0_9BACL|nr:hypothetical protein [Sporosarcina limicola]MBE1554325.1 hypothetical protein [Sporosarcina limicola]